LNFWTQGACPLAAIGKAPGGKTTVIKKHDDGIKVVKVPKDLGDIECKTCGDVKKIYEKTYYVW